MVLLAAYPGTLLGGVSGGVLGWVLLRATRRYGGVGSGLFVGAVLGGVGLAVYRNPQPAWSSAVWGATAGAVAGLLLYLAVCLVLVILLRRQ